MGKAPLNIDLHSLQINLRKYLTQLKANLKNEQLLKFRENLLEVHCVNDVSESVIQEKQSLGCTGLTSARSKRTLRETPRDTGSIQLPGMKLREITNNTQRDQRCSSLTQLTKMQQSRDAKKHTRAGEKKLHSYYQINRQVILDNATKPVLQNSKKGNSKNNSENRQRTVHCSNNSKQKYASQSANK